MESKNKRSRYTQEFKLKAVSRMKSGQSQAVVSDEQMELAKLRAKNARLKNRA